MARSIKKESYSSNKTLFHAHLGVGVINYHGHLEMAAVSVEFLWCTWCMCDTGYGRGGMVFSRESLQWLGDTRASILPDPWMSFFPSCFIFRHQSGKAR